MKLELGEKNADLLAGSAREGGEGTAAGHRRGIHRQDGMAARGRAGAQGKQGELAKINSELSDCSMMAESRQVELVVVRAQIDELKGVGGQRNLPRRRRRRRSVHSDAAAASLRTRAAASKI
jgi:hypothetical protein